MIQVIPAVLRSHNYALVASRNLVSSMAEGFGAAEAAGRGFEDQNGKYEVDGAEATGA